MRAGSTSLMQASLLLVMTITPANADVSMSGTFTATESCPAYQSFRKSTDPGDIKVEPNKSYAIIAKNKPDATHYRILVQGAEPEERWVALSCGRVSSEELPASGAPQSSSPNAVPPSPVDSTGARATHVLAVGWEPAFCDKHSDKNECHDLTGNSFAGTHLSLHGLWPQPRGTQYCNVPANLEQVDRDHNWGGLPEPDLSANTLNRLRAVMPGVESKLERHEWIVHGTCFGGNAEGYFTRAAGLAEAIDAAKVSTLFADNVGRTLTTDAIRAAFDEAFGTGAGARVTVSCNGRGDNRKITELVVSLAGDVTGSAPLGSLIHAAQAVPAGCPSGLVEATSR